MAMDGCKCLGRGSWADALAKVRPAFVTFVEVGNNDVTNIGCGTIIGREKDRYTVLSCGHIFNSTQKVYAQLFDGAKYKFRVLFTDKQSDIATVTIDSKVALEVATLGDSTKLLPGTMVGALGCPLGLPDTFTAGVVSSVGRKSFELQHVEFKGYVREVIVMNIILDQGNSGGPLINLDGEVVGVTSGGFKRTDQSGSSRSLQLGYAIPIEYVCEVLGTVNREGGIRRRLLGLQMRDLTEERIEQLKRLGKYDFPGKKGVLVEDAPRSYPASQAGIVKGDIVIKFNNKTVGSINEITDIMEHNMDCQIFSVVVVNKGVQKRHFVTPQAVSEKRSYSLV